MVEKIKNTRIDFRKTSGPIRLSVDDLIKYLSNKQTFESTTFEATSNGYKFESIDDMKANRELLAGYPIIHGYFEGYSSNGFNITFKDGAIIDAPSISKDEHIAILKKAATNLNSYRGPLWLLKYFPTDIFWAYLGFLPFIFIYLRGEHANQHIAMAIYLVSALILFRFFISRKAPVFFGEKSHLWEKIKENSLSHIIVFSLGAFLTWLASKFGFSL